ncbi:hypothetical protein CEP54_014264 [Fusarium duplospermum]|uniref:Uncharacterized protein n=1 Tax=Fusarium duplospermum TaxID=1325734 RepID=A0A428NXG1_9HYPO|nr:hypothetical protein CEP54_014264 [Fusarium duplospermum]
MATELRAQIDNKSNVGLHLGISNASRQKVPCITLWRLPPLKKVIIHVSIEYHLHSEPCFERGAVAGYQQRITAEANALDTSTLGGRHANRFTRQAVKTDRAVARLRTEKDGSLEHDSILRETEEANTGSAPTRNKFLDKDGELYFPTIAELMIMGPEDWAEFYDAFDSQGPRSH